jgi:hypothetical protein
MPRPTSPPSRIARSRRWIGFACACGLTIAFKLWLIAPDEVVARPNGYDQLRYVEMAHELLAGRWLGAYGPRTLIREPSYPVWIALAHRAGVPLRDATEALLIGAALVFGVALLRLGLPAWFAALAVALLVLQPHSVIANREVLAAGLYLPMLVLALSGLLLATRSRRETSRAAHALWAGFALGIVWTTRPEKAVAALALAVAGALGAVAARGRGIAWPRATASGALLVGVAALGVAIVSGGYALVNRSVYGLAITSDLQAPGYLAANRSLLSIEHASPRRYVPVPREVRARAYAVSPAFRELRPFLEGPGWGRNASCVIVHVCDDLAGGWFLWIFREAAAAAGHMQSAPEADAYFARIASEIDGACARGELRCHPVLLPFLHPHAETWAPWLWDSLGEVATSMVAPREREQPIPERDDEDASPAQRAFFDVMAGRRPVAGRRVVVSGRVRAEGDPVEAISVRGGVGEVAVADGPGPGAASDGGERRFVFELELRQRGSADASPVLALRRASGRESSVKVSAILDGEVVVDGLAISGTARPDAGEAARDRVWRGLWALQPWLFGGLLLAGLAGALRVVVLRPMLPLADPALAVFALMAIVAAARVALLGMIDASSFPATSSRYVYPAAALASCALLAWVRAAFAAPRRSQA